MVGRDGCNDSIVDLVTSHVDNVKLLRLSEDGDVRVAVDGGREEG